MLDAQGAEHWIYIPYHHNQVTNLSLIPPKKVLITWHRCKYIIDWRPHCLENVSHISEKIGLMLNQNSFFSCAKATTNYC